MSWPRAPTQDIEILSVLPTNMDILFSRVGKFSLIEFKINSHCFYGLKYRRNWWHIFQTHLLSYASCVRFHCIWKKKINSEPESNSVCMIASFCQTCRTKNVYCVIFLFPLKHSQIFEQNFLHHKIGALQSFKHYPYLMAFYFFCWSFGHFQKHS